MTLMLTVPSLAPQGPFPPQAPHSEPGTASLGCPHLHRRGMQWEQQRFSFPGPHDSSSEQSSRSQWGTPAWCRTEQILRVCRGTGAQQPEASLGKPPSGACPPWKVSLFQVGPPMPTSHRHPPQLTPHLQVIQLISPNGGTEGCQLWLSGNHCPAKRQPRGPSACMGSPIWESAPEPTIGGEKGLEGGKTSAYVSSVQATQVLSLNLQPLAVPDT